MIIKSKVEIQVFSYTLKDRRLLAKGRGTYPANTIYSRSVRTERKENYHDVSCAPFSLVRRGRRTNQANAYDAPTFLACAGREEQSPTTHVIHLPFRFKRREECPPTTHVLHLSWFEGERNKDLPRGRRTNCVNTGRVYSFLVWRERGTKLRHPLCEK